VKTNGLLYHDIIGLNDSHEVSGFRGNVVARYKLAADTFESHLQSIKLAIKYPYSISRVSDTLNGIPVFLTFDDGGVSGYTIIAPLLEEYGWRGHFFITTNYIGKEGFLDEEQIIELHARGHIIGSHSCSHPDPISKLPYEELLKEWRDSMDVLTDILGEPVKVASIPGGYYSRRVAEAADEVGMQWLFTSEPTSKVLQVGNCKVLGRYMILNSDCDKKAACLATNCILTVVGQSLSWNLKKLAKVVGGKYYLRLRRFILEMK